MAAKIPPIIARIFVLDSRDSQTMFELRVGAASDSVALAQDWATHVICVNDPGQLPFPNLAPRVLPLSFEDSERPSADGPMPEHMERVLDFARELGPNHRLLIHCMAGLSRSTALAVAVLVQHGDDADAALARVGAMRPDMWPNERLCRYADTLLGTGGAIMEAVRLWQDEQIAALEASGEAFA